MTEDRSFWTRAREAWAYVKAMEPARVRAIVGAVFLLIAATGAVVPGWLPDRVDAIVVAFFALVALLAAGESTRKVVTPVAKEELERVTPAVSPPPVGQDPGWSGPYPPATGGDNGGVFPPQ